MTAIENKQGEFSFYWEVDCDKAVCIGKEGSGIWQGSLLPSFHVFAGRSRYIDSTAERILPIDDGKWNIAFRMDDLGIGRVNCQASPWGISFSDLHIDWNADTKIIAMYFGTKKLTEEQKCIVPSLDKDYWPNWRSAEYCVPCAGNSPEQSFWRNWDFGHGVIPLGSFGPAMGTPYSAAFPRPLYACAMGNKGGWMAIGPGEIVDAALTLRIASSSGCMEYLYREDLWDSADTRHRSWKEPLRLAWGPNAYDAYAGLFSSMGIQKGNPSIHNKSFRGTWGDFQKGNLDLRELSDAYSQDTQVDCLLIDDFWESFQGSGTPDTAKLPSFEENIHYIRQKGMGIGIWQSIGWIAKPEEVGLTDEDLLCGIDGKPRLSNWLPDPHGPLSSFHYCMDPSSERVREFLRKRTHRILKGYHAQMLKLDFGYGLPGPDVSSPRDPALRGERLCASLLEIIVTAAKEINPEITIIYYGINPLLGKYYDLITIDDMGDCGDSAKYEKMGHTQRCMWAALAGSYGMAVNTSSGYYWEPLKDILLDTAVVGANGCLMPRRDKDGKQITPYLRGHWLALQKWRRRTTVWKPLWLDADMGGNGSEPEIRSWARLEQGSVASAVIRAGMANAISFDELPGISWVGNWALIAQDTNDIHTCNVLAAIPFTEGELHWKQCFAKVQKYTLSYDGREHCMEQRMNNDTLGITVSEEEAADVVGFLLYR